MNTLKYTQIGFIFILLACACTTPRESIIIPSPTQSKSAKDILDLPIEQIDIQGYKMQEALTMVSNAIANRSGGELHFYYGLASSKSRIASKTAHPLPVDKLVIRDPAVSIRASHTTLRDVLNTLCGQAGWSYAFTPAGYMFIDDKSYVGYRFPG